MTTTHTLAALIGLYFLAAGVGLFAERNNATELIREMTAKPMFGFLGGLIAFAIGGAIVGVHNNWNGLLSSFVSFVGWVSLLEGVLICQWQLQQSGSGSRSAAVTEFRGYRCPKVAVIF